MTERLDLDAAIEQLVNLGEKDPLEIARKLVKRHGAEWLATELAARGEEIVAQIARQRLGANRRRAEIALRTGDELTAADLKLAKEWVPGAAGGEWKVAADLTDADLDAKAGWYESLGRAALRRAQWCREVAGLMRDEGVKTLGKLKAHLPELPADDELVLPEAS